VHETFHWLLESAILSKKFLWIFALRSPYFFSKTPSRVLAYPEAIHAM
jgi:hypothetical protein